MDMKKDKRVEEGQDSSKIANINKSLRDGNKEQKNNLAVTKENKLIKKLATVFTKLDIKRSGIVLAVVLLVVLLFTLVVPMAGKVRYVHAYEVYINDNSIGVMKDTANLEAMLEYIYSEYETYYSMEVAKDVTLSYVPVNIDDQYLCPSTYYEEMLRTSLEVDVIAWVIFVNNTPVIALDKRDDAQWVLEQLVAPYKNEEEADGRTDIGFLENVEIKGEAIIFDKVQDKETALRIMMYGDDIQVMRHKVVSGESLYSICKSYGLKLSDIRKANPSLPDNGKIYSGDVLIVTKVNNIVNIVYSEYVQRVEEIPYETNVVEDSSMYVTQTRVQQAGIVGLRNIKANVVYINGSESSYEVLMAETPSQEPVAEILIKGTKAVPNVLILASEGNMALPLSSYTITSYFGSRDTGIAGASTFHNGIDLYAPYGTPIYASEDGKVSFAGSNSGYGLMVKIKHDGGVETRYGHCSTLLVKSGQYVKKGEIIALVGSTGTSSGNHVHFEVRINGKAVDPLG